MGPFRLSISAKKFLNGVGVRGFVSKTSLQITGVFKIDFPSLKHCL